MATPRVELVQHHRARRPPSSLRRWWDAFLRFDERLQQRMEASRTLVKVCFATTVVCCVVVAAIASAARPSECLLVVGILSLALAGTTAIFRWRLRTMLLAQRRRAGQCLGCGYDLRESPDGCPECGASPGDQNNNDDDDDVGPFR